MNDGFRQFVVSGQPDINGVHALVRFALLIAVLLAIAWRLWALRREINRD